MASLIGAAQKPVTTNCGLRCLFIEFAVHEASESLHLVYDEAGGNLPIIDGNDALHAAAM